MSPLLPLVTTHPQAIFRFVHREDRAAYSRMMRRTFAVQYRDLGRQIRLLEREVEAALLPPIRKVADALRDLLEPMP